MLGASLYRGSGEFTIAHIDPSPQAVGITTGRECAEERAVWL